MTLALDLTATELRDQIVQKLCTIGTAEVLLEHSYCQLGVLLLQFRDGEYWRGLGYASHGAFMTELCDRHQKGRTQLWQYLSVAEKLLPAGVSAAELDAMGVSKAIELKRALKASGKHLTPEVIAAAVDPAKTIKEVRAMLQGAYDLPVDERPGTWFDTGGFYMTSEEKAEFVDCVHATMIILDVKKEQVEWVQRKQIFLAWMREFYATHAADAYGPQATQ